jgi:DNA-binding NtrC family response regulator
MVALSYPAVLTRRDLEPFLGGQGPENAGRAAGPAPLFKDELLDGMSIEELKLELERAYLTRLYQRVAGDLKEMQKVLGVRRSNFYTWLKRVGLDIRDLRSRF